MPGSLPSSVALTNIADGAAIVAADPRNNFSAVQAAVNALIAALGVTAKGDVLAATASGALTNVAAGANNTVLTADSTQAAGVRWATVAATTYRVSTPVVVNTTVAATALINQTLAANDLGTNRVLRLSCGGDWKQNNGGTADLPRFQLSLGGTVLLDTGVPGIAAPNAVTRYGWWIEARIAEANGATNAQSARMTGVVSSGNPAGSGATAFTTGEGVYRALVATAGGTLGEFTGWASGTKDGTGTLALVLNVINGSASANYETVLKDALVVIE